MPTVYPTREAGLNGYVNETRHIFQSVGTTVPDNVRVSIGYPPNSRAGSKKAAIAVCIHPDASADGHWEIFVSPECDDNVAIFAALTHELAHTVTWGMDKNQHGKSFGKVARALGLDGPLTATYPGQGWFNWATPIVEDIEMPYASIALGTRHKPKKVTSLLKLDCPECGWLARVTMKHIAPHDHLNCPVPGCDGTLRTEETDADPE